ncbi:MAG: hypothetical protein ACLSWS_07185 [Faecalispora jeddahensis]
MIKIEGEWQPSFDFVMCSPLLEKDGPVLLIKNKPPHGKPIAIRRRFRQLKMQTHAKLSIADLTMSGFAAGYVRIFLEESCPIIF